MSDYVVLEDSNKPSRAEFSCQTEEIALGEVETQTDEETISGYKKSDENPEISYWATIVANRKSEVERIKKINEKMQAEKAEKLARLEEKQTEYQRLFDMGNDKLNGSNEEEESVEEEKSS
ncbi:unnamed protein product [Caenorhabditis brenneri]